MEYFPLKTQRRNPIPEICSWYGKLDERKLTRECYHELPGYFLLDMKTGMDILYQDILTEPFFMVSKEVMDVLKMYEEAILDESRRGRITGYLSNQLDELEKMKDTVIPVDICFEKLLLDVEPLCQSVFSQFTKTGIILSQEQFDAIVIAKYQCYMLGGDVFNAIKNEEDRETLYDLFLEAHGKNGNFSSRTNVEMNIYFGNGYEVEGELIDVIVEPLEEMNEE